MSSFSKFSLRRFWPRVINAFNFSENRAIYHSHSVPSLSLFIYYLPIYSSHRCVPTDGWSIISRIEISRWMKKKKKKFWKFQKGDFYFIQLRTKTSQFSSLHLASWTASLERSSLGINLCCPRLEADQAWCIRSSRFAAILFSWAGKIWSLVWKGILIEREEKARWFYREKTILAGTILGIMRGNNWQQWF